MGGQPDTDDDPRAKEGGRTPVEGYSELPRHELRRRALAGVFVSFSGGLLNLVLAFGGNLVLAGFSRRTTSVSSRSDRR